MAAIKTLESGGRIALGEEYAGQRAVVDEVRPGLWMIRIGDEISTTEDWLHTPEAEASITRSLQWLREHPPSETDLEALRQRIEE